MHNTQIEQMLTFPLICLNSFFINKADLSKTYCILSPSYEKPNSII